MTNITNVSISLNDGTPHVKRNGKVSIYPNYLITMVRKVKSKKGKKTLKVVRRFSASRFGTLMNALQQAKTFIGFAQELPNHRFKQIKRNIGRPRHSHLYAKQPNQLVG